MRLGQEQQKSFSKVFLNNITWLLIMRFSTLTTIRRERLQLSCWADEPHNAPRDRQSTLTLTNKNKFTKHVMQNARQN